LRMERLSLVTEDDLAEAVAELRSLGGRARKLLEECVAHQGITRAKLSQAALSLSEAGFVFIRDKSDVFESRFEIVPSLAGEEALEAMDSEMLR
jgi:hypothetical protein